MNRRDSEMRSFRIWKSGNRSSESGNRKPSRLASCPGNDLVPGSARDSRVGLGVSPKRTWKIAVSETNFNAEPQRMQSHAEFFESGTQEIRNRPLARSLSANRQLFFALLRLCVNLIPLTANSRSRKMKRSNREKTLAISGDPRHYFRSQTSRGGEIGRRTRLRIWRRKA